MTRKRVLIKRPRVSEPSEKNTDDGKLVDLTRCDAAENEAAVKAKGLVDSQFLNPAYSDLSIICGDKVFPAHRIIVCPQSIYFENACKAKFEGDKGEIEINDRDATLVEKMLQFVYTGDYTCDTPPETGELVTATHLSPTVDAKEKTAQMIAPDSHFHAQMYAQGDYFQIEGLKAKVKERFEKTFLNTANEHSFAATVIEVYTLTAEDDRGLRDIVVQLTRNNLHSSGLGKNRS
ncbi:BTB/POZ domain-containing protein [Aspergillus novofumigatus IBT 16806]|uniref:BTB domain-containing protein n=1 Tax=Aspergillus novofumigatus (strain IBT 16806) TaxID=1392255 RepID=A0A2I1CJ70_ASPN1|nr:uncharacterized protein P174DRAFT_418616 [Aspergillus novofumigatus IBT 16806]PKX97673.1 hypothetical protein P174DRAFT_418616 [Aspergillus novofumigatus IBT 16806]